MESHARNLARKTLEIKGLGGWGLTSHLLLKIAYQEGGDKMDHPTSNGNLPTRLRIRKLMGKNGGETLLVEEWVKIKQFTENILHRVKKL